MFSAHPLLKPVAPGGGLSTESTPQVIVRAGKHYVCSACGVLVELPADVVGQIVVPYQAAEVPDAPVENAADEEPPTEGSNQTEAEVANEEASNGRSPELARVSFQSERIDGLVVPSTQEMERLLAWINYRLKRLGILKQVEKRLTPSNAKRSRQGSAPATTRRVEEGGNCAKVKPQRVPCPRPRGHANKVPLVRLRAVADHANRRPTDADNGIASRMYDAKERGPP